jgi:hypothetical protein
MKTRHALLAPLLAWCFMWDAGAALAQGGSFSPPVAGTAVSVELPPLPVKPDQPVDMIRAIDAAAAFAIQFSAARYDLESVVESLEADPYLAYAFVRNHIAYEPYTGALRGAQGVLGGQTGNDVDQSLLLSHLLNAIGVETRWQQGLLSQERYATLLASSRHPVADLEARQTLAGLGEEQSERLRARARKDWQALDAALSSASPVKRSTPGEDRPHLWVQAKIDGQWVDMDATFTDGQAGTAYAAGAARLKELPADAWHTITLAVVMERLSGQGALQETTLLAETLRSDAAQNTPVYLTFSPENPGIGGSLFTKLTGQAGIVPLLHVDQHTKKGRAFEVESPAPNENARDFLFGEGGNDAPLTALYLDVTVSSPGASPVTERKILLDQLGDKRGALPEAAQTLAISAEALKSALYGVHQIAVSTGATNPRTVAHGIAFALDDIAWLAARKREGIEKQSMPEILWPLWAMNEKVILGTELWTDLALGGDAYIAHPRVTVFSLLSEQQAGQLYAVSEVDWLIDGVTYLPSAERTRDLQLWYGALQSAYETTLSEQAARAMGGEGAQVESTSTLLSPPLAFRTAEALPLAAARVLKDRYRILTSPASAKAWWRYDPETGSVKAMLSPAIGGSRYIYPGNNYVNTPNNPWEYHIDPETGISRRMPAGSEYVNPNPKKRPPPPKRPKPPPGGKCSGGTEYLVIMNCVSIPLTFLTGVLMAEAETRALESATAVVASLPGQ